MLFNYLLGIKEMNKNNIKVNCREAARGIIFYNNNILMVSCNKGDYKLPGGGIDAGESYEEALRREVREETGYIVDSISDMVGIVTERRIDVYDEESIFEMRSYYYVCKITEEKVLQNLDDYEKKIDLKPLWTNLDNAISNNEKILKKQKKDMNLWVNRETIVLKELKKYYNDI